MFARVLTCRSCVLSCNGHDGIFGEVPISAMASAIIFRPEFQPMPPRHTIYVVAQTVEPREGHAIRNLYVRMQSRLLTDPEYGLDPRGRLS